MAEEVKPETTAQGSQERHQPVPRMLPLLSRRSLIGLAIGFVVGALLGLWYWALSPSISEATSDLDVSLAIGPSSGLFESHVKIQIVHPGSSYRALRELQSRGEYYAAKANSLPFLKFLSDELAREGPEHQYSIEQLSDMLTIAYDYKSDQPALTISVVASGAEETLFLAAYVPHVFEAYLLTEEAETRQAEYESVLRESEEVREALLQAQTRLTALALEKIARDTSDDPVYVALAARADALQLVLDQEASKLAALIAAGETGQEYTATLASVDRISRALGDARSELATLKAKADAGYLAEEVDYASAQMQVANLDSKLAELTQKATSLLTGHGESSSGIDDFVAGNPSIPFPVPPDRVRGRTALMMGAVFGVGAAWVVLNFKWLIKGMPSSQAEVSAREEET